jgi:Rrf2 family protein
MFNLSKKTEYGLMALAYLSSLERGQVASVGEIAQTSAIPRELLAKILSELVKAGLAISFSGPTGGFRLARPASAVSLAEIVRALEKKSGLVDCTSQHINCTMTDRCSIRAPMTRVHKKVNRILEETMLEELLVHQRLSV